MIRRSILAAAVLVAGCTPIASGGDDVIALEVRSPATVSMIVGDTVILEAVALTASGMEATDAQVFWAILDVDSGQVGFTLDTLSGEVVAVTVGNARVQARVETLRSDPFNITVSSPPPMRRRQTT